MAFLLAPRFIGPCCPCNVVIPNSASADGAWNTDYLSKTFGTNGNRRKFTVDVWYKYTGKPSVPYTGYIGLNDRDRIQLGDGTNGDFPVLRGIHGGAVAFHVQFLPFYRDPGAWMHAHMQIDTEQAVAANRVRYWINGLEIEQDSAATIQIAQNTDTHFMDSSAAQNIFAEPYGLGFRGNSCYFAQFCCVNNATPAVTEFGEYDANGNWVPKSLADILSNVTFDSHSFALDFADNATIGKDVSGNGNNFTENGSVSQYLDSPTDSSAANIGNYAFLSPIGVLNGFGGQNLDTLTKGNTQLGPATGGCAAYSTIAIPDSVDIYFEATLTTPGSDTYDAVGIVGLPSIANWPQSDLRLYSRGGQLYTGGWTSPGWSNFTAGDVIGVVVSSRVASFYKNGNYVGAASAVAASAGNLFAIVQGGNTGTVWTVNFGQTAFVYSAPGGAKRLSTANLPAPALGNPAHFHDAHLRTGTGASVTTTGIGFLPDLVWTKSRSNATNNNAFDVVRGVQKGLVSNSALGEYSDASTLTAFTADGYTYGADSTPRGVNTNAHTYVDWLWKAGGTGSSNSSGSITCTLSANLAAGISIATFNHASGSGTIGHGLGVAPACILTKSLSTGDWAMAHIGLTNMSDRYVLLDTTGAESTDSTYWNNTAPTSSVWSIGSALAGGDRVAYCFVAVPGFSAFGKFIGNANADGPFVWCGFRPRFLMLKRVSVSGDNWFIFDTERDTYNVVKHQINPNVSNAESSASDFGDILSNGFKLRSAATAWNSGTIIYLAFAEYPFGGAGVSQARAR